MAERVLVAVAVVAIAAIDFLYLALVQGQGGAPSDTPWVVPFVAGYLVSMALVLALSLLVPAPWRLVLRGAASAGLVVLGLFAAFSIGLAVLIAAGLAIAATVLEMRSARRAFASVGIGAVAGVAVLLVGFQISWSHIECPANGESGGTTAGVLVTSYQCVEGVLTVNH